MTPEASRYGPYAAERPLARAPGAMFLEGRADDGSQVLLQVVHLSPAADASAEERRQSYVHMAARATEDLQRDEQPKVLEHASVSQDDGSLSLWWALPWVEGAEQLGVIQPPTPDELLQWSAALLHRLQDRHVRGRVDPLLSPSVLVVRSKMSPQVVGLPIHLPLEWPAPELAPPPRAPEEIARNEPGPLGDIWRVGRCLSAFAAGVATPPERWGSFLSRLVEARPTHRYQTPQAALQELQRLGHSAPTLPMGANLNNLSSDLLLPNDPNDNLSEPLLSAPPETNDSDGATARAESVPESGDTRLDFPSPLKADSPKVEALPSKKSPQTYAGGGELETIRAPFPKDEPAQEPVVETPRAPSTLGDGETLLDVIKPKEIRQYGIPDEPPTDPPPGPRPPMMAEDPASQMTLRDVSREKLEAMDSGEEPTDERENREKKRKSWDGPAVAKPAEEEAAKPADKASKLLATGPRGTVVGVRMIDDPTGMRELPQDALPKMLPPPEPSRQPEAPSRPAASPSGDIPLPAARIVNHITDVPKPGGPAPGEPLPQAPGPATPTEAAPPPRALVHAPQPPAWAKPAGQPPGSVPPPKVPPMKTIPHGGPAPNQAWPGQANRSLVPAGQGAPPAAWGPPAEKPPPKSGGASGLFIGVTAFFVAGAGAALLASGVLTDSSELVDGQLPAKMVTITAANEVLVQATPSNAVVISERTGRILGSTPLRFLVPGEGSVAIMIAAKGHEPQRVLLPARGRIRTDLVPLPDSSQTCELKINAPTGVSLEGVAGATQVDGKFLLVGAALVRGTQAEGAWLVRCPQLGGQIRPTLTARPKSGPVMLRVIGPTDADVSLNGEPLGRVPVRQRVQPGFHEVAVEKISRGRVERLVPVFTPTKLRMPRPELKKPGQ